MLERKTIFAAISLIHNRFVCYLSSILHLLTWNSLLIWYNKGPYILLLYQSSFETIIKWNFSFHEIVFCLLQNIWESEREWDKKNTQKKRNTRRKKYCCGNKNRREMEKNLLGLRKCASFIYFCDSTRFCQSFLFVGITEKTLYCLFTWFVSISSIAAIFIIITLLSFASWRDNNIDNCEILNFFWPI